jgi:hypothetical protein
VHAKISNQPAPGKGQTGARPIYPRDWTPFRAPAQSGRGYVLARVGRRPLEPDPEAMSRRLVRPNHLRRSAPRFTDIPNRSRRLIRPRSKRFTMRSAAHSCASGRRRGISERSRDGWAQRQSSIAERVKLLPIDMKGIGRTAGRVVHGLHFHHSGRVLLAGYEPRAVHGGVSD